MNQCIFDVYSLKIRNKMRFFIVILALLLSLFGFSQENGKAVPSTNSQQYNNNAVAPTEELREKAEKESIPQKKMDVKDSYSTQSAVQQSTVQFEQYETQSTYMRSQRTPSTVQQQQMDDAVKQLEKTDPNSFEYNFFKYISGNYNTDWFKYLKQAEKIRSTNSDVQTQMAAYYLITGEDKTALSYIEQLVKSGRLSSDPITYAHDLLKSAPLNGVLLTHGFDDTYSVHYLQLKQGMRKDVELISLDYLQSETYRKALLNKGFKLPGSKVIDVNFVNEFCKLNEAKSISISMTTPKEYLLPMKEQLYVVGLTFEYHSREFNNYYANDYLWQKELNKKLINHAQSSKSKDLSANYLPMLLLLRTSYSATKETTQLKEVNEALDKVAVQCNKYQQVQKLKKSY